ncbi:MAG: peroxiredoxin [Candidatus Methanomethylophilaceae archaeon]|nr:peroxiredoxin [Candidatus Methanomethylophilaceae archaeon]MBQ8644128.1 peroxiredoxin [Candidatus Methanomethylophilaceae archaeon]
MDVGDRFPDFVLLDEDGKEFDSRTLEGIRYVIYFYPKDGTAGCLREAQDFTANIKKFMVRNMPVIGVSKDSPESHRKFINKNGLMLKLLSDPDHVLLEAVGAWGKKMMYGKEVEGTIRSTFIVGKDGIVEAAWTKVKVDGHVDNVVATAASLVRKSVQ